MVIYTAHLRGTSVYDPLHALGHPNQVVCQTGLYVPVGLCMDQLQENRSMSPLKSYLLVDFIFEGKAVMVLLYKKCPIQVTSK